MRALFAILIFTFAISNCEGASSPILSNLKPNECMRVELVSVGCFNTVSNTFVFEKETVTIYDAQKKKPLGTLPLSKSDLKGIDKSFRRYANPTNFRSSTKIRITAQLFRENKLIEEYEFLNRSSFFPHYDSSYVTFGQLIKRIDEPKRDEMMRKKK